MLLRETRWAVVAVLALLTAWSVWALGLSADRLIAGWHNLGLLWEMSFPPDPSVLKTGWKGIRETLHIAFLGTLIGAVAALPLALLASRNLFPAYVGVPARAVLSAIRVMPSLLWAILFVMVVGLGPLAGVLAMALYTVGLLGKLQYEAIEGLDREPFEAMEAIGATRLQTVVHVAVPEAANALLASVLFLFEYNVRHTTVIGVVGAGGIGYYLMGYLRFFQYDRVVVLLAMIFAVVVAIDAASRFLRHRFLDPRTATHVLRPRRART